MDAKDHDLVPVHIDEHNIKLAQGQLAVAALKTAGNVPLAYELDQLIHGKLVPLPDDGFVEIKGGEHFTSQPRKGHSA